MPVGGVVCFHDSHVCDNVLVGYAHWFILHMVTILWCLLVLQVLLDILR